METLKTTDLISTQESKPKVKASYRDLINLQGDIQKSYEILYKYYKASYSKNFNTRLIYDLLQTETGLSILLKYIQFNIKNAVNIKSIKLVNVSEYEELVNDDIKFRLSDSRFVNSEEYRDLAPTVVVLSYNVLSELYPKPCRENAKSAAFIIDLVGKYRFRPHVKAPGSYEVKRMGQAVTKYSLEPYAKLLPTYKYIEDIYMLRADNLYASYEMFNDLFKYEETHESVYNNVTEKDMEIILGVLTQTAVNGSKIYGYEDLPSIDSSIKDMVYDRIINHKVDGNIESTRIKNYEIAKKYDTKKTVSPSTQYLSSNSVFLDYGFRYVEYDQDSDLDKIQIVNNEFKALMESGVLPSVDSLQSKGDFTIRIRKLGRENTKGLYCDELKTILIGDESTLIHEYAHLIDYNFFPDVMLSELDNFIKLKDKYTLEILKQIQMSDLSEVTLQRELDNLLIPEEVFAITLEYYLTTLGIKGFLIGSEDTNVSSNKFIKEISFKSCAEPTLLKYIEDYFSALLGHPDHNNITTYFELKDYYNNNADQTSGDLSSKMGTTPLDYSDMSKEERHICILAKKYVKNITINQVRKIVLQTDTLYDDKVEFPKDFMMVFQYDEGIDSIVDIQVVSREEFIKLSDLGYRTINTKSMIKTEQNYYEIFYAVGVQGQEDFELLLARLVKLFHQS